MRKLNEIRNLYLVLAFLITGTFYSCTKEKERETSPQPSPTQRIDSKKAIIKTNKGSITISFLTNKAPNTSLRVQKLIEEGFYDGLSFHRVVENYIVQTGDPTNTGNGGSGVKIKDEINDMQHIRGSVAMAKNENVPDSADSQFYIAINRLPDLDGKFTVFARVTDGLEVLDKIVQGDKILAIHLIEEE